MADHSELASSRRFLQHMLTLLLGCGPVEKIGYHCCLPRPRELESLVTSKQITLRRRFIGRIHIRRQAKYQLRHYLGVGNA